MMKLSLFIFGVVITYSGAILSFYPVFQDFNETDYVVPFYKSDDYPNSRDLLIANVNADCNLSDNIFSQYTINNEPICTIAQNLIYSLLLMIFIGIVLMIIAVIIPSKISEFQKNGNK